MAQVLTIDARYPEPDRIERVRRRLDAGAVVALPTDTLYGLGANALDAAALERVFALKRRDTGQPLPVVVRDVAQARALAAELPPIFFALADEFWPGPLSLVVTAAPHLPARLHAGTGAVAVRQPDCRILLRLLDRLAYPLTATSANRSGAAPARSAAEVAAELGDELDLIVDGGPALQTMPSTLLDLSGSRPRVLRAGAIASVRLAPFLDPAAFGQ